MLEIGLKLLFSYLVGSINGSLVLGRFRGIDIRTEGSGNAGATNALRTHGFLFALFAALIDLGKGVVAVALFAPAGGFGDPLLAPSWTAALCGIAAVIGHIYPFWHDFRGGKGGATAVGALLALAPVAVIAVLAVWVTTLVATGYVGLSTMMAAITVPVFALLWRPEGLDPALLGYGLVIAMLVVFAHRSNIRRMREGSENREHRAMFWRKPDA